MKAVLWDLDGTLVDSEEYHWLAWRDAMRGEGIELTYERFLGSFGQRNDRILGTWLGPDVDPDRVQRIGDAKEAVYRRLAETRGLQPLPGARRLIVAKAADTSCEAIFDADGGFTKAKCTCKHFRKFGIRAGPCRHLLALRLDAGGAAGDARA